MTIIDLLLQKHAKDTCVPECKTGPSWYAQSCPRLDFLAMKRSWAHPNVYGYEIKHSRNDFLRDNKWRAYLEYCTDFYFVAPQKILDKSELPDEAGLIVTSANRKRLFTIKKAPSRSVDIPDTLFKYILICRANISRYDRFSIVSNIDFWKSWLETKDENKKLGYQISKKIRQLVEDRIEKVSIENAKLKNKIETLEEVKQFLISLGMKEEEINSHFRWGLRPKLEQIISEKRTGIPGGLKSAISNTINSLKNVEQILNDRN